jgi:tRNA-Thr(GGU) m(6)t(6)A37 methyltransferase TsaA
MSENTITFQYIGRIQTPYKNIHDVPTQPHRGLGVPGKIIINPELKEGLDGLENFSYIAVIFHLHRSENFRLRLVPYLGTLPRGVFATRSPKRPNPVGLSILRLVSIEDNIIFVENVDMLNGTPILDVKPYIPFYGKQSPEN